MIRNLSVVGAVCIGFAGPAVYGQDVERTLPVGISEQFLNLCVSGPGVAQELPGSDVKVADAPSQLKRYAEQAMSSRVVRIGDSYAMRAHTPARADPVHAVIIRCAVTGSGSFSVEVSRLSEKLATSPNLTKTQAGFDAASFRSGLKSYNVYAEADGWVSIFSLDIMMRNIDPKYLKEGTKPTALPPAR